VVKVKERNCQQHVAPRGLTAVVVDNESVRIMFGVKIITLPKLKRSLRCRDVHPPNSHDATLPLHSLLSAPLPFLPFPTLPSHFHGRPPEKFLEFKMLIGEF